MFHCELRKAARDQACNTSQLKLTPRKTCPSCCPSSHCLPRKIKRCWCGDGRPANEASINAFRSPTVFVVARLNTSLLLLLYTFVIQSFTRVPSLSPAAATSSASGCARPALASVSVAINDEENPRTPVPRPPPSPLEETPAAVQPCLPKIITLKFERIERTGPRTRKGEG